MRDIAEHLCVTVGIVFFLGCSTFMITKCAVQQERLEKACTERGGTDVPNLGCVKFQPLETK